MMFYKVLIILTVPFIINCDLDKIKECNEKLLSAGFSNEIGYLNFIISKQFNDLDTYVNYYKNVDVKNDYVSEFFNENFEKIPRKPPLNLTEFCTRRHELLKSCNPLLNLFIDSVKECTEKITKIFGDENQYKNIVTSIDILLNEGKILYDDKVKLQHTASEYAKVIKELPTPKSTNVQDYLKIFKKRKNENTNFKKYYTILMELKIIVCEYWYYNIQIWKKMENNDSPSYSTTLKWCENKINFENGETDNTIPIIKS